MNLLKTAAITAALCAASPLLLANAQVSANAAVQTQTHQPNAQPSVLNSLGQNVKSAVHKTSDTVKDAAQKTGEGLENGAEKTKAYTKHKWQDSKDFSHDKVQEIKEKTAETQQPHNTGFNGKAQAELNTPAAHAQLSTDTEAAAGAQ